MADAAAATAPETLYTWEEIRKHNKDTDCWVVLYGKVLNVTSFLNDHPGGLDPINDLGGYDITNQFEAIGHSKRAVPIYESLAIGKLDPTSVPPKVERKAVAAPTGSLKEFKLSDESSTMTYVYVAIAAVCLLVLYLLL